MATKPRARRWFGGVDLVDVGAVAGLGLFLAGLLVWFGLGPALTVTGMVLTAGCVAAGAAAARRDREAARREGGG